MSSILKVFVVPTVAEFDGVDYLYEDLSQGQTNVSPTFMLYWIKHDEWWGDGVDALHCCGKIEDYVKNFPSASFREWVQP